MKRNKFITNFRPIREALAEDTYFMMIGGGGAYEEPGGMESTARLLYSVYLYLDFFDNFTIETMKDYLFMMCKYQLYGQTFEYHLVNTTKLKMDEKYPQPWYYCESSNIHNEGLMSDVFLALGAAAKAQGTLNWITQKFEQGTE